MHFKASAKSFPVTPYAKLATKLKFKRVIKFRAIVPCSCLFLLGTLKTQNIIFCFCGETKPIDVTDPTVKFSLY